MTDHFIQSLTPETIMNGGTPLLELMQDSVFSTSPFIDYPFIKACLIHNETGNLKHFIFCNPGSSFEFDVQAAETASGYAVLAVRSIEPECLFPNKWPGIIPPGMSLGNFMQYDAGQRNYGYWIIFENQWLKTDSNASQRFSVLYLGANPLSIYEYGFKNLGIVPAMADFRFPANAAETTQVNYFKEDSKTYRMIMGNNGGIPDWIVTNPSIEFKWKHYKNSRISIPNVNGCFWKKLFQVSLA
ncbi:MAG: hypothetical protein ACK5CL_08860 [Sphingomonadales bacterium]|jgi:hypothetical protein